MTSNNMVINDEVTQYIDKVLEDIKIKNPSEYEFHQATKEVLSSLKPLLLKEPKYMQNSILERIVIPERTIIFRVSWMDDNHKIQTNTGYRVQFNSSVGIYKGGLRFHPSVNLGIIKFLGFEQIFKNSLTGLSIGGAKGGSDFDPKGKSDGEILRFCQSFMNELYRHIGSTKDVPAGDIGVGGREIAYLFGQYKKLTGLFDGVLTGKGLNCGGSMARKEATGYGSVYFAQNMLKSIGKEIKGMRCCVSGSGNVALYTIQKLHTFGAVAVACSDSKGTLYHENGLDFETLKEIKEVNHGDLKTYTEIFEDSIYTPKEHYAQDTHHIWSIPCDIAFPSATQNELNLHDAKNLIANGVLLVNEGANMPTTLEATKYLIENGVLFAPAKAANAGGVATSQLEMAQNSSMVSWSFEEVDKKLKEIMDGIFKRAYETAKEFGCEGDLIMGANIAGFKKVADAMIRQGV